MVARVVTGLKNETWHGSPSQEDVSGQRENVKALLLAAFQKVLVSVEAQPFLDQLVQGSGLDTVEQALLGLRNQVGAALAQAYVGQNGGYAGSRALCSCGRTARFVRHAEKSYVTLVGEVRLARAEYSCPSCGAWRPLEQQWDLPEGHYSRGVVQLATLVGAELPFERATEALSKLCGMSMSPSELRRVCERVGAEIGRQQAAEEEHALSGAKPPVKPPAVLVVGIDGAHVNTREGGWKETKVGVAARCEWEENKGKRDLKRTAADYAAVVGGPEEFGRKLYTLAHRVGLRGQEETIILGDGAPWIWHLASEHFPEAVQVLDFYHLAEHVHVTAKALYGDLQEGPEAARRWAEMILDHLRNEDVDLVLDHLRAYEGEAENLVRYIESNRNRMRYRWLQDRGYPTGSGIVESACKQIVHTRHRQAGMRWAHEHVQEMLELGSCLRGQRWEAFWARKPKVA